MTTPGSHDIASVLSSVSILSDILDRLRRHALEITVNAHSRRSLQVDLLDIEQTAAAISEAAKRLAGMCATANADLPAAPTPRRSSEGSLT